MYDTTYPKVGNTVHYFDAEGNAPMAAVCCMRQTVESDVLDSKGKPTGKKEPRECVYLQVAHRQSAGWSSAKDVPHASAGVFPCWDWPK